MRNTIKQFVLLIVAAALLCPALYADTISLKNGDRLTGTIVKSDAKTLVLKTEAAGEVTLQWSAIDTITSTQPLHVGLAGGQMVVGPVATKDGQIQVTTQSAGVVSTSKDSVQVIRSDSDQAAYDAAMERLQHPHLGDFWSGTLDTGLSVTRGNSSTLSYTLARKGRSRNGSRQNHGVHHSGVWENRYDAAESSDRSPNHRRCSRRYQFQPPVVCVCRNGFQLERAPAFGPSKCGRRRSRRPCHQDEKHSIRRFRRSGIQPGIFRVVLRAEPDAPAADYYHPGRHAKKCGSQCRRAVRRQNRQTLDLQRNFQLFSESQRAQWLPIYVQYRFFNRDQPMAWLAIQFE